MLSQKGQYALLEPLYVLMSLSQIDLEVATDGPSDLFSIGSLSLVAAIILRARLLSSPFHQGLTVKPLAP